MSWAAAIISFRDFVTSLRSSDQPSPKYSSCFTRPDILIPNTSHHSHNSSVASLLPLLPWFLSLMIQDRSQQRSSRSHQPRPRPRPRPPARFPFPPTRFLRCVLPSKSLMDFWGRHSIPPPSSLRSRCSPGSVFGPNCKRHGLISLRAHQTTSWCADIRSVVLAGRYSMRERIGSVHCPRSISSFTFSQHAHNPCMPIQPSSLCSKIVPTDLTSNFPLAVPIGRPSIRPSNGLPSQPCIRAPPTVRPGIRPGIRPITRPFIRPAREPPSGTPGFKPVPT